MKLPLAARKNFRENPNSYSPASSIRMACELENLINANAWDVRFDFSLKSTPKNDVDVIELMNDFFKSFSTEKRFTKEFSGLRWTGVYVPETLNPKTSSPNPHTHGLIKFFRKGNNIKAIVESLKSVANGFREFKDGTSHVRELSEGENPSSYFTSHVGDFLVLTKGSKGFNL